MAQIVASGRLAANSRVVSYDTELQMRANIFDIWGGMKKGIYNRQNQSFPMDSCFVKVKDQKTSESVITLKENLQTAGVVGEQAARGTEEPPQTLDMRTYQDNLRKVIPIPGYGLRKMEGEHYKLWDQHKNGLGLWNEEQKGYDIRHCHLEKYDWNMSLANSNVFASLTPEWNPNMFIPGLAFANQPAYVANNRAQHTANIVNGLLASGGLGQLLGRTLTAPVLEDISNFALQRRLKRMKIPGLPTGMGFILTISELQAALISNPTVAANNLGALYIAKAALPDTVQKWRGVIGAYNDLLLVVDPRQPTLYPTGTAAPFTLTAGYMTWDSADGRNRNLANIKDTAFLVGAGNFVEVEGEKLHWISDQQDYDFRKGVGTACVRGYNLPIFTDTNNNTVYDRGAVIVLDLPNGGALSV